MNLWHLFFLTLSISATGFSQSWSKIDQADFNIKYKLPTSWEVDGFGSGFDYWDDDGSSVCDCAGTINYGPDRLLGMVIYPIDSKSDLTKREYVWVYHFRPEVAMANEYITKKLTFVKTISNWEKAGDTNDYIDMLNDEVWMFTVTGKNYGFVIYFWGDINIMKKNEKTIYKILDSFVQYKK